MPDKLERQEPLLSDEEIIALAIALYQGVYTPKNLPVDIYELTIKRLQQAVLNGFGHNAQRLPVTSEEYQMLSDLLESIKHFSGAKTFCFTLTAEGLLVDNGEIISQELFIKKTQEAFKIFYESWLDAEYETAITQAESAADQVKFLKQKHIFPMLEYVAVEDEKLCGLCGPLDGMIRRVDDPIWITCSPARHIRCRCKRVQRGFWVNETIIPENLPEVSPFLKTASWKTKQVFPKEHPYFTDIPEKYLPFAKRNFNLPL